jgi:molybdenum cofactor biosynthesis protein B
MPVPCLVITLSDSATYDNDPAGSAVRRLLEGAGHLVLGYHVMPEDPMRLKALLIGALGDPGIHCIVLTGGMDYSTREGTVEVVEAFLEKRVDGFGELFRYLSYQEQGSLAMLSRAVAGTNRGRVLIALPGTAASVELALQKLILPELEKLVEQARR